LLHRPLAIRLETLGLPFREAIKVAGKLGADGVEFDAIGDLSPRELSQTGRREIRHLLRQSELKLVAIGFPTRHGYDHPDRLEARIEGTAFAMQLAYDLGCGVVINHIGKIPEDESSPQRAAFVDVMRRIAADSERNGALLAIQTMNDLPDDLAAFLDSLALHGLAVNFAPANLVIHGINLIEAVNRLGKYIVGVHARDVVRSGLTTTGVRPIALGEGEVGWRELLPVLGGIEYTGHFTIFRESKRNDFADLEKAAEVIQS
jgi:sugar phosphate isomerase/epimerase